MSYLTLIARLFHYLLKSITAAHLACRIVDRVESYVSKSNCSDAIKAQALDVKTRMHALCTALETFKANLPD